MAEQGSPRTLSTYAEVALYDWQLLAKLITRYSTPIQRPEEVEAENPAPSLLSQQKIEEALAGPYSAFLKEKMLHYSFIMRIKSKHITSQQEFFKHEAHNEATPDINGLTAEMVAHVSLPTLEQLELQLNQLTLDQNQQWIDALNYWKNGLLQYFNQSNMQLSELEIQEFQLDLSATQLLNQFAELKINPPKTKNGCATFGAYLKLKSALAVFSSLSRRMQTSAEKDVEQILKPLLNYFTDIEKYENQMLDNQSSQVMQVLQPIAFALPQ